MKTVKSLLVPSTDTWQNMYSFAICCSNTFVCTALSPASESRGELLLGKFFEDYFAISYIIVVSVVDGGGGGGSGGNNTT